MGGNGIIAFIITKAERFIDNDDANALVKDKYREPFVVPEIKA